MVKIKRLFLLLSLSLLSFCDLKAQYPSDWKNYTTTGHLYDIQSERKDNYTPDRVLVNNLLDIARTNLAKQIQIKIEDNASIDKSSVNGYSNIIYNARTTFSTDVDVNLLETKSYLNTSENKMYVIAFINKSEALRFYQRQIDVIFNNVDKHISITETYVETGFKSKAKDEIKKAESEFAKFEKPIFFLTVFDCPDYELQEVLRRYSELEQLVKRMIADLEYGTNIYVECTANMFGFTYSNLSKELKAKLSEMGCNFTDDRNSADWAIMINANSRQYNTVDYGNVINYFSYVDAEISLEKVVTNQRIYEDMLTEKGGHTHNFNEAARVAYKKITPKIINLITENIKQ